MADENQAVIMRGPKKISVIRQFLNNVDWGELDVLLIDTPPGTSDEHIIVAEELTKQKFDGAIIVTTPQNVSIGDVRRQITFCKRVGIQVLGLVENMSGFVCPHCSECSLIFSSGGGEQLAKEQNVPYLGSVPIDPNLSEAAEKGQILDHPPTESIKTISQFVSNFVKHNK